MRVQEAGAQTVPQAHALFLNVALFLCIKCQYWAEVGLVMGESQVFVITSAAPS